MTDSERAGLSLLAPYAIHRIPAMLDKIPDLAALAFGGVLAWSAYARIRSVSALARQRKAQVVDVTAERPWNYSPQQP